MRFVALAGFAFLAGCEAKTPAPVAPADTAASAVPAAAEPPKVEPAAPEPVWVATGPALKAIPDAFRGRWDYSPESCEQISTAELMIDADAIDEWEIGIELKTVTPVGPNTFKIEGTGHEEDQTYDATTVMRISDDGQSLTLAPGPNEQPRVRCKTPNFPGPELEKKMLEERARNSAGVPPSH